MDDLKIGDRIKLLRNDIGLTQFELAERLGISKSALAMYETNKREPNLLTIIKLCKILDTDGNYLVGTPPKHIDDAIIAKYNKLNKVGQQKATEYIDDLSANEKYISSNNDNNLILDDIKKELNYAPVLQNQSK